MNPGKVLRSARAKVALAGFAVLGSFPALSAVSFADTPPAAAPPVVNGWVQVSSAAQLEYIDQNQSTYLGANIELMSDIDLSTGSGSYQWVSFGTDSSPFTGSFNGQGHTVTGWKINDPSATGFVGVGFFGDVLGTVQNLGVDGSVAGGGGHAEMGVLAGELYGTIRDSFALGTATNGGYIGGLVGLVQNGSISNSYADVSVSGGAYDGGLVGRAFYSSSITDSYAYGSVQGFSSGGLIGWNEFGTMTDSFFDTTTTGQPSSIGPGNVGSGTNAGGTGRPTATMQTRALYTTPAPGVLVTPWDFTNTWGINPSINNGYPYLLVFHPGSGSLTNQLPEVPVAGALPLAGALGVVGWAIALRRKRADRRSV